MKTIKFKRDTDSFYKNLEKRVRSSFSEKTMPNAKRLLWIKLLIYSTFFITSVAILYSNIYGNSLFFLTINYVFVGLIGILLAFNSSHDAVHNTFSKNKLTNSIIFHLTFNLQGVNGRLWKIRHLSSHHLFANVDGCDADIDDNPLLRLSPTHKKKTWHKYQYLYAPFLYMLYTLHWIFIKDLIYFKKKELANLINQNHSIWVLIELILWKLFYFTYMIILPLYVTEFTIQELLIAFVIMHLFISLFFVFTLIISHLCMETEFPVTNEEGYLPYNYYQHQLAVSLDYNPTKTWANWIFGGFNSHSAHHLFPNMPHTCYTKITPAIKETALEYNYPYNELNILKAVQSHFMYLKNLGE